MKILYDTIVLLAPTIRSRVYLQNMIKNHILPSLVILLPGQEPKVDDSTNYNIKFDNSSETISFTPSQPLFETIEKYSIPIIVSKTADVNSIEFIDFLKELSQPVVIYSEEVLTYSWWLCSKI